MEQLGCRRLFSGFRIPDLRAVFRAGGLKGLSLGEFGFRGPISLKPEETSWSGAQRPKWALVTICRGGRRVSGAMPQLGFVELLDHPKTSATVLSAGHQARRRRVGGCPWT